MQRYDSYKDSGMKWLGEIPSHWEVCKIKHHYKMFTGFTPPTGKNEYYSENQKFAWVNIGDMKNKYIDDTKSHLSELVFFRSIIESKLYFIMHHPFKN